jgi:uncharacterized membrane protein
VIEIALRALRLLAVVAWVGGLAFFAFVVAPVAFHRLPSTHEAGLVVGGALVVLHWIGLISGALFYVATGVLWLRAEVQTRAIFALEMMLAGIMLATTAYSQYKVLPAMERDRVDSGGAIETADSQSPARVDFERLHVLSERLEGAVFFCGLGVVLLLASEARGPETGKIRRI